MTYGFSHGYVRITTRGFPHSETFGSLCTYHSPERFAVRCVLLQLLMPRHPPYALINLITACFFQFAIDYCLTLFFLDL